MKHGLKKKLCTSIQQNGGDPRYGGSNIPLRGIKGELWEGGSKSMGLVYSPRQKEKTICDIDGVSQWKYLKRCCGSGRKEFAYQIDDYVAKSAAIRYGNESTGDTNLGWLPNAEYIQRKLLCLFLYHRKMLEKCYNVDMKSTLIVFFHLHVTFDQVKENVRKDQQNVND
ncbi:ARSB [Mytilus coruscus]|uniref:ARSB n=1 Tax=Mytilus coruscus TaxID=42192 RepID=A0A6J8E8M9_MYTCO|nr:ARSB [Mytilus coruscus]